MLKKYREWLGMSEYVYEILSGDKVVCEFSDEKLSVLDEKLAPLYIQDFRAWVSSRSISVSRGLTSRNIKRSAGISANAAAFETSMRANAACVTDNYWVRLRGSGLKYKDVCFDGYDGFFSRLALGLDNSYSKYLAERVNPELTNIGNSDKAWYVDEPGARWLYKKQPLTECYNEVLTSVIASGMGINTVKYELIYVSEPDPEIGRIGIVRSRDFTQGMNINLEPADMILKHWGIKENDIAANARAFAEYGLACRYLDIAFLDLVTGNPDRHSFNYGVLRNRNTGIIKDMAPNYDNNFAFMDTDFSPESFEAAARENGWSKPALNDSVLRDIAEGMTDADSITGYTSDRQINILKQRYHAISI